MTTSYRPLRFRQIHLDFHTSEHIPGIGSAFDPDVFVSTFKAAHVDSVTLFAKCHHGWSYYPTNVGAPHPNLVRPDLLGDMVKALTAADIECPIYISVQWDERNARLHPEWRVRAATPSRLDPSQLKAGWHTLCLNHADYRAQLLEQAREVVRAYDPPGLFFDIVLATDCVCQACLESMAGAGLDPERPADRLRNDERVNATFRNEMSAALHAEFPGLRIFYNCGHIHKQGRERFAPYSHLELESLPTGGWGYDHFPVSARYAATLGLDYVAHTGKFHTSWGEFGGFKHPHALAYEAAQMAALGSKCLVGDQLHPNGAINPDTYASIAPAYARIARLEPYLVGAKQVSQIAILSSEYFNAQGDHNVAADDGAAQMLLEMHLPFDVIDGGADFSRYQVIILPDDIPVDAALAARLQAFLNSGGGLLLSGNSGRGEDGEMSVPAGIRIENEVEYEPTYVLAGPNFDAGLTRTPFVVYGRGLKLRVDGAEVLAEIVPPYFNRSYAHFCSHQHAPDNPDAETLGPAVTLKGKVGYIAFPIFSTYHRMGQPLYRHLVRGLLNRLLPRPVLTTDLPSSGRASLTHQAEKGRYILHLLYGPPQVRGKHVPHGEGSRVMEMIEDIPAIGPVTTEVVLPSRPSRAYDALSGAALEVNERGEGLYGVTLDRLHIHAAIVFETD
ncbi:alpha-amylase family protein [uncultured Devosia sp.]|uniref:alpha-amylase family protein n=1 Tax=uncultured Devosia sp. TaxID=211434 RepID=UPI002610FF51|nr:alpha-amylase family protein [uncultured Devosia sp.]